MKAYSIEVSFTTVVMAEDEMHALKVAEATSSEAFCDTSDHDYGMPRAITEEKQLLSIGWDGECLPYGGDGETRLSDIIAALPPPRDTKTIDMFASNE
jgi:hypothetical protein